MGNHSAQSPVTRMLRVKPLDYLGDGRCLTRVGECSSQQRVGSQGALRSEPVGAVEFIYVNAWAGEVVTTFWLRMFPTRGVA